MRLPHLTPFTNQPLIFLTACVAERKPILATDAVVSVLRSIWQRSAELDGWWVGRFVVMPDHAHLFVRSTIEAKPLAAWVKTWKSLSSRELTATLKFSAPIWQRDYFDHFVRSAASYSEKWEYVRNNPVRKGLVADPEAWPHQGEIHALQF